MRVLTSKRDIRACSGLVPELPVPFMVCIIRADLNSADIADDNLGGSEDLGKERI